MRMPRLALLLFIFIWGLPTNATQAQNRPIPTFPLKEFDPAKDDKPKDPEFWTSKSVPESVVIYVVKEFFIYFILAILVGIVLLFKWLLQEAAEQKEQGVSAGPSSSGHPSKTPLQEAASAAEPDQLSEAERHYREGNLEQARTLFEQIIQDPRYEKQQGYIRQCLLSLQKRMGQSASGGTTGPS
jgi:hypothetical protein